MGIINNIKIALSLVVFAGIPFFLWYREKLTALVFTAIVAVVMLIQILYIISTPWPKKLFWFGLLFGAILNQIAVWSNGGMMPVKGGTYTHGLWRPMVESDKVKFLCDIYCNSCSIGDLIVFGSIILLWIFALAAKE